MAFAETGGLDGSSHWQNALRRGAIERKEDARGQMYNMVGFQTHLLRGEQERVFRMIPGLEQAEFQRYGMIHR